MYERNDMESGIALQGSREGGKGAGGGGRGRGKGSSQVMSVRRFVTTHFCFICLEIPIIRNFKNEGDQYMLMWKDA